MKPILIACSLLALLFVKNSESAYLPAGELAKRLLSATNHQSPRETLENIEAVGYVLGAIDAMNGRQFCVPRVVTRDEVIQVVAAYLREHVQPEAIEASFLIKDALRDKYPCKPIP
jgi:hypothetical protein